MNHQPEDRTEGERAFLRALGKGVVYFLAIAVVAALRIACFGR